MHAIFLLFFFCASNALQCFLIADKWSVLQFSISLTHERTQNHRWTGQPKDPIHHASCTLASFIIIIISSTAGSVAITPVPVCVSSVQSNPIVVDRSTKQAAIIVSPHTIGSFNRYFYFILFFFCARTAWLRCAVRTLVRCFG